jgi:hypothetical protein
MVGLPKGRSRDKRPERIRNIADAQRAMSLLRWLRQSRQAAHTTEGFMRNPERDRVFSVDMIGRHAIGMGDRIQVNCNILVTVTDDEVTWIVDGEPVYSATSPDVLVWMRAMLDRFAGIGAVFDQRLDDTFQRREVLVGDRDIA